MKIILNQKFNEMKKVIKKANLTLKASIIGAVILGMSLMVGPPNVASAQVNPQCPNGCLTTLGTCYCYGTHAYKEAVWPKEEK